MDYWGGTTGRLYPNVSACIAAIRGMYDVPDSFGIAGIYCIGGPVVPEQLPAEQDEILQEKSKAENEELVLTEKGDSLLMEEA